MRGTSLASIAFWFSIFSSGKLFSSSCKNRKAAIRLTQQQLDNYNVGKDRRCLAKQDLDPKQTEHAIICIFDRAMKESHLLLSFKKLRLSFLLLGHFPLEVCIRILGNIHSANVNLGGGSNHICLIDSLQRDTIHLERSCTNQYIQKQKQ